MPSRQPSTSPPSTVVVDPNPPSPSHPLLPRLIASTASACSLFLLSLLCSRRNKRTTPSSDSESKPPYRFSYSLLRRATNAFSTRIGHGGFGPVFSGNLPSIRKPIAVKLMDSASLQGEREFHNELFFASRLRSTHVVPAIGFSCDRKPRRFLLVYELMQNGNLQDALLHRKCPELMGWKKRFAIIIDIAKGIHYLHSCDPPVIHGDIKPSNVLLDGSFSAKIGDYGLARLKSETQYEVEILSGLDLELESNVGVGIDDCGSLLEETQSVNSGFETTPDTGLAAVALPSKVNFDKAKKNSQGLKSHSVKDWWWKQDNEAENKKVKDHVMEWNGKQRPESSSQATMGKPDKKKSRKPLERWVSLDEEKRRPPREWWKEEDSEELAKKKKKKKKQQKKGIKSDENGDDDAFYGERKKRKSQSRKSYGTIDWWFDGFSRNSYDSASASGEIPKSGGISSTPSMRGAVCYVAPEYSYGGEVTEKCDVYGFGVLLLVIISGRRPLQVSTGSPLSELQRANLVSRARHCARHGKLLELVDQSVKSLDKEQALLCIKVALLCLIKSPSRRPSMEEVVGMLSGTSEPPQLPLEYSSSPPSRFPFKSHGKGHCSS